MTIPVVLSWSGGKDCSLALYYLKQQPNFEIVYLLTTITETYQRISMHGVRVELLNQQAAALNIPLITVPIPASCTNEEYEDRMRNALEQLKNDGIQTYAFGDIFLSDVRQYRENQLDKLSLKAIFPIWGIDTTYLSKQFLALGFKAILTCVDTQQIDASWVGHEYNQKFLKAIPSEIDPCGEKGEFHTFTFDGPIFSHPLPILKGEKVLRDNRFYYCDLTLA
ncbi:MAG: diphthine--ammonia ligase [Bacteroidales bacterium]|nr:diphthine--ammonia ligase [Bacteroidales bacterium]HOK99544.1 diphthine--ammonia ligase [Bacteroidales bacterium]HPO66392.1 diphthine--ammonia ligase [Bacteroidales bacterium]